MIFSFVALWSILFLLVLNGRYFFGNRHPLWISGLLGLVLWMSVRWIFGLFGPFAWIGAVVTVLIGLFQLFRFEKICRSKRYVAENKTLSGLQLFISALMLTYAAYLPLNFDTGAYHLQTFKWLSQFGTVPGIANLDIHFGAVSGWFSMAASLEPVFPGRTYHFVTIVPWMLVLSGTLIVFKKSDAQVNQPERLFGAIAFPVALFFSRGSAASLSPDVPALIFGLAAVYLALQYVNNRSVQTLVTIWILCLGAVSSKLSMAPLVLLPISLLAGTSPAGRLNRIDAFRLMVPAVVVVVAFVVQNALLSGWPLFPAPFSFGWHPDWQVPVENVRQFTHHVKMWGIRPDYQNLSGSGFLFWVPDWVTRNISIHFFPAEMLGLILVFPFAIAGFLWIPHTSRKPFYAVYLISWTGLIFWFLSSPNPRFGTLWIFSTALIPAIALMKYRLSEKKVQVVFTFWKWMVVMLLLAFVPESGIKNCWFGSQRYLIRQMRPAPQGPVVPFPLKDGTQVWVPETGSRVFNAKLPAARSGPLQTVRRGTSLHEGFRSGHNRLKHAEMEAQQ